MSAAERCSRASSAPTWTTSRSRSPRSARTSTSWPNRIRSVGSPTGSACSTAPPAPVVRPPSSTSTWRSSATSTSPSTRSSPSSTRRSSRRCRPASCCRPTSRTPTPPSTGSAAGPTSAMPAVERASRSGSSRAPTWPWRRWRPSSTTGRRLPTPTRARSTRPTSGCSRQRSPRETRAPSGSASPVTTSSRSPTPSSSPNTSGPPSASTWRCWRAWRLPRRARCASGSGSSCCTPPSSRSPTARPRSPTSRDGSTRTPRRRTS